MLLAKIFVNKRLQALLKIRIGIAFIRLMSLFSLKMARNFGKVLGYCAYLANTRLYKTSLTNLRLCFPQMSAEEIKDLAIKSLMHTGMTLAECGPVWLWPVDKIMQEIEDVEGADLLQNARDAGFGVILLGPHHGNWELMGLYLSSLGRCSMLYLDPKNQDLDDLLYAARSRGSAKLYPADKKGAAAILLALKQGEMVGILPDQIPVAGGGEFTPFFGNEAFTMTLVSRLIQKTGAKALLTYAKRTENGFKVVVKEPATEIYAEHMPISLLGLNKTVEIAVKDSPEQYQWEYKRFRYQPEGKQEPYNKS
jgi:Kdo2-lipid IVA lauroyltransferase/acyltransferase